MTASFYFFQSAFALIELLDSGPRRIHTSFLLSLLIFWNLITRWTSVHFSLKSISSAPPHYWATSLTNVFSFRAFLGQEKTNRNETYISRKQKTVEAKRVYNNEGKLSKMIKENWKKTLPAPNLRCVSIVYTALAPQK